MEAAAVRSAVSGIQGRDTKGTGAAHHRPVQGDGPELDCYVQAAEVMVGENGKRKPSVRNTGKFPTVTTSTRKS